MLTLRWRSGGSLALPLRPGGSPVTLGRAQVPGAPRSVSKAQCQVALSAGGGHAGTGGDASSGRAATLTTLSQSAPTLFICGATGAREALPPGAARQLREGDAFALVAAAPDDALVSFSWNQGQDADDAGGDAAASPLHAGDASPPTKRARVESGAADVVDLTTLPAAQKRAAPPPARAAAAASAAIDLTTSPSAPPPPDSAAGGGGGQRPVVLVLSGVQGSGKSTFCAGLPASHWQRVNQDSVANGRPGTRQQCLMAALGAARALKHVAVDRMHLTAQQRSDFLALAAVLGLEAHAVELALPLEVCAERARGRVDHEGGLGGEAGARAARISARGKDNAAPGAGEGFARVVTCRSDADVAAALRRYANLPPPTLPPRPWTEPRAVAAISDALQTEARRLAAASGGSGGGGAAAAAASAAAGTANACAAGVPSAGVPPAGAKNAFAVLMSSAKSAPAAAAAAASPPARAPHAAAGGGGGGWDAALVRVAAAPERAGGDAVLFHTDALVALKDAYPKARSHTLLLARTPGLDAVAQLRREHAPLLAAMREAAAEVIARERKRDASLADVPFRVGFHSLPSMRQVRTC